MATAEWFQHVSKLLPELVFPLTLAFLSLIIVLLGGPLARWRRILLAGAISLLWLGGSTLVSDALTRSLERWYLPDPDPPTVDAIVVLGGTTEPAVPPRTNTELFGDASNRLVNAARLYHRGKAPVVFVCGGRSEYAVRASPEAPDMIEMLQLFGVPKDAILEEDRSRNTFENAVEAKRVLDPLGLHRLLLVTSALHMPRAVGLFRHQGFEILPAPTDFKVVDAEYGSGGLPFVRLIFSALVPNADALAASTKALREYLGIAVYRALGLLS